jgi:hypothetical protein
VKANLTWATVVLSALAVGCAAATPEDLMASRAGSEQAQRLLESFADAVRAKDPTMLRPLLSLWLGPDEIGEREARLKEASWLASYSGYTLDASQAVSAVSWRVWRRTEIELEVPGTAAFGRRFEDEFELVRTDGEWRLRDFHMTQPREGDVLEPPEGVKRELEAKARQVTADLQAGRIGSVLSELPSKGSGLFREPTLSFWQKLFGMSVPPVPLYYDFELLGKLMVTRWPQPEDPVVFRYAGSGCVAVHYELSYVWPEGGIRQRDILRMSLIFLDTQQGWAFYSIRLSGKAIPYS